MNSISFSIETALWISTIKRLSSCQARAFLFRKWCVSGQSLTKVKEAARDEGTVQNVRDSDRTVVIYFHELEGGTAYTIGCCMDDRQPHRLIDAAKYSTEDAATLMVAFVMDHSIETLNIAGP